MGQDGRQLLRERDPYEDAFGRWIQGDPALPAGADDLLVRRARALADGERETVADLTTRLAVAGVVVRDEKSRELWRPAQT